MYLKKEIKKNKKKKTSKVVLVPSFSLSKIFFFRNFEEKFLTQDVSEISSVFTFKFRHSKFFRVVYQIDFMKSKRFFNKLIV